MNHLKKTLNLMIMMKKGNIQRKNFINKQNRKVINRKKCRKNN